VVILPHAIRLPPAFFQMNSIATGAGVQKTGSRLTDRSVS